MGDDAFGVEVVAELARRRLPDEVRVIDFGIRSYDLAFALTDPYEAVILVDAVPRGEPAGTVYLLELDVKELPKVQTERPDGHSLNPVSVLQMAQSLGDVCPKLYLIGCEPARLEAEEGQLGLSGPATMAVPQALGMIEELVTSLLAAEQSPAACLEQG